MPPTLRYEAYYTSYESNDAHSQITKWLGKNSIIFISLCLQRPIQCKKAVSLFECILGGWLCIHSLLRNFAALSFYCTLSLFHVFFFKFTLSFCITYLNLYAEVLRCHACNVLNSHGVVFDLTSHLRQSYLFTQCLNRGGEIWKHCYNFAKELRTLHKIIVMQWDWAKHSRSSSSLSVPHNKTIGRMMQSVTSDTPVSTFPLWGKIGEGFLTFSSWKIWYKLYLMYIKYFNAFFLLFFFRALKFIFYWILSN